VTEEKKGLHRIGYCLVVVEDDPSVSAKKGDYFVGYDTGTYGSGYPIFGNNPKILFPAAAAALAANFDGGTVKILPVYVDHG